MVEIEYVGTASLLDLFTYMLEDEGLSVTYESRPRESKGAAAAEIGRVILHVDLERAKTLGADMLKKSVDLGEVAVITLLAQRARRRFKDRVPKVHVEILDDDGDV
jgi:hypothetical protein